MIQSNPRRGPYRARGGELPTVTRNEIALREYGPTPFPAYEDAAIVGVRALLNAYGLGAVDLDDVNDLDDDQAAAVRAATQTLLDAGLTPADVLAAAGGQDNDDASTTPDGEPETRSDTPEQGAVKAEPDPSEGHHSGPVRKRAEALRMLIKKGMVLHGN
jgi:hypothetical protein